MEAITAHECEKINESIFSKLFLGSYLGSDILSFYVDKIELEYDLVSFVLSSHIILNLEVYEEGSLDYLSEDFNLDFENRVVESFQGHGIKYEEMMRDRIANETCFSVELTKASGDHGADLIIRKQGYSAVVQLKLYSSAVGNKSVQEAYTAKQHYHVGHAFVVTNSTFTRSAYEVAETTGVMLFKDEKFIEYLKSDFLS